MAVRNMPGSQWNVLKANTRDNVENLLDLETSALKKFIVKNVKLEHFFSPKNQDLNSGINFI